MEIKELKVAIGEVYEGYFNDAEEGVVGYSEKRIFALNIRNLFLQKIEVKE